LRLRGKQEERISLHGIFFDMTNFFIDDISAHS
jgi:hypothetical protein